MAAPVSLQHVAAGCNRCTHALHWGDAGLLAYAAHNAVMVYEPQVSRTRAMQPLTAPWRRRRRSIAAARSSAARDCPP